MQPSALQIPALAFTCPRCRAPASAAPSPQRCGECGLRFVLVAGPAADASVIPSDPASNSLRLRIKTSGVVLMHQLELERTTLAWGDLDPVVGVARMQTERLAYPAVISLALWREINLPRLVANLLLGVPITIWWTTVAITTSAGMWLLAAPAALITAMGIYGALGLRMHSMRLVSPGGVKEVRMRRVGLRGRRFFRELLRRVTGQPEPTLP